jgi:hypothetical protein
VTSRLPPPVVLASPPHNLNSPRRSPRRTRVADSAAGAIDERHRVRC